MLKTVTVPAAAVALLLLVPACGPGGGDETTGSQGGTVTIVQPESVAGWLSVDTPGPVISMQADENGAHLLGASGLLLFWSRETGVWNPAWVQGAEDAFDIALLHGEPVLLTPQEVIIVSEGQAEVIPFQKTSPSIDMASSNGDLLVLFRDGSVLLNPQTDSLESFQPGDVPPLGGLIRAGQDWAWINTDGTMTLLDSRVGLCRTEDLPDSVTVIAHEGQDIYAGDGSTVYLRTAPGEWAFHGPGSLHQSALVMSESGIRSLSGGAALAGHFLESPIQICASGSSPIWLLTDQGLSVWSRLDQVETLLPDYDLARIELSLAGQTGAQHPPGATGVVASGVAVSGLFRIYESVSSRPDPFTEFPAARRDLRRSLIELSIEELHLVGITLDPSGGDQAMVEDANGVAYILQEGSVLANNTHIAEITSNEVIVVQEVTVGSAMQDGTTTSIPTIYSMRLHEEGGI
ncbi:MAG: hypothetical protein R6V62_04400 [Candidatus Fermentibacteraceae bacterium]